jgi:hypothetical protein
MKPPVPRILILPLALRTHAELRHGGLGSVIRDILDDGEPRSTVRAVGKGVSEAPVQGIKDLPLAGLAGGNVRGKELVFPCLLHALPDFESLITRWFEILGPERFDAGAGRGLLRDLPGKLLDSSAVSFDFEMNPFRGIMDPSRQGMSMR